MHHIVVGRLHLKNQNHIKNDGKELVIVKEKVTMMIPILELPPKRNQRRSGNDMAAIQTMTVTMTRISVYSRSRVVRFSHIRIDGFTLVIQRVVGYFDHLKQNLLQVATNSSSVLTCFTACCPRGWV